MIEGKGERIEQGSKLNFIINILKEFEKICRLGFSLNNISPDSIVLNKEKDQFHFTQFNHATKFMLKGDKTHICDLGIR